MVVRAVDFNYITNTLNSMNSNISESYNSYYQNEYIMYKNILLSLSQNNSN